MDATYSQVRDAAFDVIAAAMTATPLGSPASHKQLGADMKRAVGVMAERLADEIGTMIRDPEGHVRPLERYELDPADYTKPGEYDVDAAPAPSTSSNTESGGGLFDG